MWQYKKNIEKINALSGGIEFMHKHDRSTSCFSWDIRSFNIFCGIWKNFRKQCHICSYMQCVDSDHLVHLHRLNRAFSVLLTFVMLNKLMPCPLPIFSKSDFLIQVVDISHTEGQTKCRARSVSFFRSQLIWIYTVCKGRVYPGSEGQGLKHSARISSNFVN